MSSTATATPANDGIHIGWRAPSNSLKRGKTPVITAAEAKELIESIDISTVAGLRDRAIIGLMLYSFSRVADVVGMRVTDVFMQGKRT